MLLGIEDRDSGRQLIERARMRLHLLLQIRAHRVELGHVDGNARASFGSRTLGNVEHVPRTEDNRGETRVERQALTAQTFRFLARAAVEQLEGTSLERVEVLGVDSRQISLVG